jgi:hypothetical protein
MAALGTSEKGAKNVLPQLKAAGLFKPDGSPTDLALDLRDDDHYAAVCEQILSEVYPEALRSSYDNPDEDWSKVASWFMRNAGTGSATAGMQAKLYLTLLKGELPTEDPKPARKRVAKKSADGPRTPVAKKSADAEEPTPGKPSPVVHSTVQHDGRSSQGPALHIDLQIHISADASDSQIDAVFKSMAKHLYGRE